MEDGYALSAEFDISLGPRIEEAVFHGIPLYFNFEFDASRARKYWADEHVGGRNLTYRLSYHALTQQYRLSTGALHRSFANVSDALRAMGRISALPVFEKGLLKPGEKYLLALRLSLDHSQLPKPLQLDAIANRDWQVDTAVLRWQYQYGEREGK